MKKYIFDVDGTLTPSRGEMDPEFFAWFDDFCSDNEVYFVTGSDYAKTVEQLGDYLCEKVAGVYNCSGNVLTKGGIIIRTREWKAPDALYELMNGWLQGSKFPLRTGNHIEERPGMINFSIIGRGCTRSEREEYVKYDLEMRERETIAGVINTVFDDITATVGGETGIDIAPKGADKSQILTDFGYWDIINFYGDKMMPEGNDWPLAVALVNGSYSYGKAIPVTDWKDTWSKLKEETSYGIESLDPDKRSWYYDGDGTKRKKDES